MQGRILLDTKVLARKVRRVQPTMELRGTDASCLLGVLDAIYAYAKTVEVLVPRRSHCAGIIMVFSVCPARRPEAVQKEKELGNRYNKVLAQPHIHDIGSCGKDLEFLMHIIQSHRFLEN